MIAGMKVRRALFAAALFGCGAEGADEPDLVGLWWHEYDSRSCALVLSLKDGGAYEQGLVCELQDGRIGVETYRGTYEARDGELVLTPTHSSCTDASRSPETLDYELLDTQLRLTTADGVLLLERFEADSDGSAVATYGCYAADGSGTFAESPVAAL